MPRAGFGWENYHTLDEIYAWLDELLAEHPAILTPHLVGYSHEGREIRAVKLSHRSVVFLTIICLIVLKIFRKCIRVIKPSLLRRLFTHENGLLLLLPHGFYMNY